jgi:hypothetical protein
LATKTSQPKEPREYRKLTDSYVQRLADFASVGALANFADVKGPFVWDSLVPGLRARFGSRRVAWSFRQEYRQHKKRRLTQVQLGTFPSVSVKQARKLALQQAGRVAAGRITPGKREALKLDAALDGYIEHLRA